MRLMALYLLNLVVLSSALIDIQYFYYQDTDLDGKLTQSQFIDGLVNAFHSSVSFK